LSIMKYLALELRNEYKEYIRKMYTHYKDCNYSDCIAKVILCWMFEYFTGCFKMTIDKDGNEKRSMGILKKHLEK